MNLEDNAPMSRYLIKLDPQCKVRYVHCFESQNVNDLGFCPILLKS